MSHLESPITPSIGRIVLVRGGLIDPVNRDAEYPAIITRVWGQNNLSVQVFGSNTSAHLEGVKFDSDSAASIDYAAWRWMDYQVQNAAKKDVEPEKVDEASIEISTPLSRVKAEHQELDQRWNKLSAFLVSDIYRDLSKEHRQLLLEQQEIMGRYGRILTKRISLLEREA